MQRLLRHPVTLIIVTILAGIFYFSLEKSSYVSQISAEKLEEIRNESKRAEQEVKQLQLTAERSQSAFSKEKVIRDELLMQKPGEYIAQLSNPPEEEVAHESLNTSQTPWQQWKQLLFSDWL